MPVKPVCIQCDNIWYSYDSRHPALQGVSFEVREGDYVGIIGPNGAGKSTLVKIIAGALAPDAGEVQIYGHSVSQFNTNALLGYVPQRVSAGGSFFPATVREVVESGRVACAGIIRPLRRCDYQAVEEAMAIVGITKYGGQLLNTLSGGERQRVFIARALAAEPKILILDEPTVGVDKGAREKFENFLEELNQQRNITILVVSHDIDVAAEHVKYVLCLNNKLVCHVTTSEFVRGSYLDELYGQGARFIRHEHNE